MIEAILRFSIKQRGFVVILGLLLIGLGIYNATLLPIDAVPDITNRQVVVNVNVPGLGPEEVERRITFPLEVALAGLPNLLETRSLSQFGLSQVQIVFEDSTDIYFARQLVNERIAEAKEQLPPGTRVEVGPVSTGLGEIYNIEVSNPNLSLMERRTITDWIVRPQLRTVPGLAEVNTWGGTVKQYHVEIDPQKLQSFGMTVRDVVNAVSRNNANVGGGYIRRGAEQQIVRTTGILTGAEDIRNIVVGAKENVPITVGQVASVVEGGMIRQGAITQDGKGEQVFAITMLLVGENGRVVVERVKDKVKQIEKALPEGTKLIGFLDRSELIGRTLKTATTNLIEGGLLVIAVLFLFLLQFRAGLIVSSAIPLSMLFAIIGMRYFNVSANLMSLGAIDFGLIVDGAVIIVENCVRRLSEQREHFGRELTEQERLDTIYAGSVEVRKATQFGELIIIATYLPILTLEGIEGKMFRPMGLTVILALTGAMLLSFTLIPALCGFFLRIKTEKRNPLLAFLTPLYQRSLQAAMRWRWVTVGAALLFMVVSFSIYPRLGSVFIPKLQEGSLAVLLIHPPSIALEEKIGRMTDIEKLLKEKFPDEIDAIVSRIGRSELATDPMPVSISDGLISLKPVSGWKRAKTQDELTAAMAKELEEVPGIGFTFSQPIELRMNELIEGIGIRSDLGIKLFGPDRAELARIGGLIRTVVANVPGNAEPQLETTEGLPQLEIAIDRAAIARYGINVADINEIVEAALGGSTVTQITDGSQRFDVAVRLPERYRSDAQSIGRIFVPTPDGRRIPLSQLAAIKNVTGPVQISRENGQRRVVIQSGVRGRDLGSFVEEVKARIEREVKMPPGYFVTYGGTYEKLQSGAKRLAIVVPLTFVLVFALLYMTFGNAKHALLVFTGIPFAVTGGILALWIRRLPFSISAGIGFIALAGVAVLNGVVMLTFINQLRLEGISVKSAVLQGAVERLRPVLMTACVASFGFVPMALSGGAGGEVQRPLATVVIGGLITSTLLTLIVLPTLYTWFERDKLVLEKKETEA
jgi:heavy metal efflux system protein